MTPDEDFRDRAAPSRPNPLRLRVRIILAVLSGLLIAGALAMVLVAGFAETSPSSSPSLAGTVQRSHPLAAPARCQVTKHRKCTVSPPATPSS